MNAFKAFKACVPIEWSPNLYITLVRGMPGTRRLHRRTLEALRLRKCNRTVMRWNTPTVRGMLQQVSGKAQSEFFFLIHFRARVFLLYLGSLAAFKSAGIRKGSKWLFFFLTFSGKFLCFWVHLVLTNTIYIGKKVGCN